MKSENKLKVGILGVGHLGMIHLKCIQEVSAFEVVGIYDPDEQKMTNAASKYKVRPFSNESTLLQEVDAVIIVSPTTTHFELAKAAICRGIHVFIEKPVTETPDEAKTLLELSHQHNVIAQVGHVERFNPAFTAIKDMQLVPMFIEVHRIATFNPRGMDVSVVLDLMIHDLDIILSMVDAEVKQIRASGVGVIGKLPDIANARIEFENGCVANLTASRMSFKQMRKLRLFQQDAYISMDFLEKETTIIRLYEEGNEHIPEGISLMELNTDEAKKFVHIEQAETIPANAIQDELKAFANAILEGKTPAVSLEDGYRALKLAFGILNEIEKQKFHVS
ncbi:MAG: Gfo/Idh/MocA family oxidoreductase [Bacteroidota bacterium]